MTSSFRHGVRMIRLADEGFVMTGSVRPPGTTPDLRRLRDEAKRRVREGEFPALAAAHFAIAREHGFVSWPRLKAFVTTRALDGAARAALPDQGGRL